MRHLMLNLCAVSLALAGCGDSTNTSISDSGTSTGPGPVSSSESSGEPPVTTGTGEPVTTGSISDSDSASTTLVPGTDTGTSDTGELTTTGLTTTGLTTGLSSTGDTDDTSTGAIDSTGFESTGSVVIMDCDTFQIEFDAEVKEIRSCTMDDECGVEMKGTSCGCTRNWVARKDADLSDFEELVALADQLGCDLPFISTCDCPAAEGFACSNSGICTWNYL